MFPLVSLVQSMTSMTVHPSSTATVSGSELKALKNATLLGKNGTAITATAISAIVIHRLTS